MFNYNYDIKNLFHIYQQGSIENINLLQILKLKLSTPPQLLCTFYMDPNTYGSLMAFAVGLVLRVGGGEQQLNFHPFIPYPGNEDIMEGKYNFPYKTLAMVSSLVTTIVASWIAKTLFTSGILSPK